MNATKATEQNQDSQRQNKSQNQDLDRRYGKIGISAVAAAVRPKYQTKIEQPHAVVNRHAAYDCD